MCIVDFGKSSTETATAYFPLVLWLAGNEIVQVFWKLKQFTMNEEHLYLSIEMSNKIWKGCPIYLKLF